MNTRIPLALLLTLLVAVFLPGCAGTSQRRFDSPNAAAEAFIAAIRADNTAELSKIFGDGSAAVLNSGDPVADDAMRKTFLAEFDAKHSLESVASNHVNIVVGQKDWPLPIPIVRDAGKETWYFDTEAGKQEILNRRVGRNELSTIQTCLAVSDAQRDYAHTDPDGNGLEEYAKRFFSTPGTKDGLYWPSEPGHPPSPLGSLVSEAANDGYTTVRSESGERLPFHGYYYRMLTSQGQNAAGGMRDYVLGGWMIGGFAAIAWPADYGNSGVMTFMINQDGVVYEKDLGPDTAELVSKITAFDPGEGWKPVGPDAVSVTP